MDPNIAAILAKINEQDIKIDKIYKSVESTRKYFLMTMLASVLTIVLPLVGIAFSIPYLMKMMNTVSSLSGGLDSINSINGNLNNFNLKQFGL